MLAPEKQVLENVLSAWAVYGFGNMGSGTVVVRWAFGHRVLQVVYKQVVVLLGGLWPPLCWATEEPPPGQARSASGDSFTGCCMAWPSFGGLGWNGTLMLGQVATL